MKKLSLLMVTGLCLAGLAAADCCSSKAQPTGLKPGWFTGAGTMAGTPADAKAGGCCSQKADAKVESKPEGCCSQKKAEDNKAETQAAGQCCGKCKK